MLPLLLTLVLVHSCTTTTAFSLVSLLPTYYHTELVHTAVKVILLKHCLILTLPCPSYSGGFPQQLEYIYFYHGLQDPSWSSLCLLLWLYFSPFPPSLPLSLLILLSLGNTPRRPLLCRLWAWNAVLLYNFPAASWISFMALLQHCFFREALSHHPE